MVHGPVLTLEESDPPLPGRFSYHLAADDTAILSRCLPESEGLTLRPRTGHNPRNTLTQTNVVQSVKDHIHFRLSTDQ